MFTFLPHFCRHVFIPTLQLISEWKLCSSHALASAGTSQPRCRGHKAAANISSNEDKGTRDEEPVKAKKSDTSNGKKVEKTRYVVSVLFIQASAH